MHGKKGKTQFERIYFLGAGFSAGAHYPVGGKLTSELVQYLQGKPLRIKKELPEFTNSARAAATGRSFCEETLGVISTVLEDYFLSALDKTGDVDVTEFFSISHALSKNLFLYGNRYPSAHLTKFITSPNSRPSVQMSKLYDFLAAAVFNYFLDISDCINRLPGDIAEILGNVSCERDAIVSFNWDEEVDYYFTKKWNVAYTLGSWRARKGILILKPHGSIGWYDVIRGVGNRDTFFIAEGDERLSQHEKRILSFWEIERPVTIESDKKKKRPMYFCPPIITPPTFSKSFEYPEQNWIWQDVLEICSNARQFVFLGYSLPQDDYLTRAAIRNALQNNPRSKLRCLIVNRDHTDQRLHSNYASVFRNALDPEMNYLHWTFGSGRREVAAEIETQLEKAPLLKHEQR